MKNKVTTNAHTREVKKRITRSEALLDKIIERISYGESLNKICSTNDMPTRKSFYEWVAADDSLLQRYETAMRLRADSCFDEILEIADNEGIKTSEDVARAKLRVDSRKWTVSKMFPKKYGDKSALDLKTDTDNKLTVQIIRLSDEEEIKGGLKDA